MGERLGRCAGLVMREERGGFPTGITAAMN